MNMRRRILSKLDAKKGVVYNIAMKHLDERILGILVFNESIESIERLNEAAA